MIDVHAHVIPNIDDGAKSLEEAYSMLLQARNAGFTEVIATSHYIEGLYEVDEDERNMELESINKILKENSIAVKVLMGSEIYICREFDKSHKRKKGINSCK